MTEYTLEQMIEMADILIKKLCHYGGGNFCDCKFFYRSDYKEYPGHPQHSEQSGCAEARTFKRYLQKQLDSLQKSN